MKRSRIYISSTVIILVVFLTLIYIPYSEVLESKTWDLRGKASGGIGVNAPIVILAIDDPSFEKINIRWPWPRQILANTIIKLKDLDAKVIGLDIILSDGGYTDNEDNILEESIKYAGNVIIPSKRDQRESSGYIVDYYTQPLPKFRNQALDTGFANLLLDRDNYIRRIVPYDKTLGDGVFSFAFSIMNAYDTNFKEKIQNIPLAHDNSFLINYSNRGAFQVVPIYKLLNGTVDPEIIKDKIVLIGAYFKESNDQFLTPLEDSSGLYGVEIHGHVINTIYNEKFLTDNPKYIDQLILLLLIIIITTVCVRLKPLRGLIYSLFILSIYTLLSFFIYSKFGLIIEVFNPSLGILLSWLGTVLYNYLVVEREKKHVRNTFSRFVSPEVVNSILDSDKDIELGGEIRDVAIFFSDIRGFTSISENMNPRDIVEMLNEYFTEMTDIIFKYNGTVNKYIGDAIMAIFGAPIDLDNNSERALRVSIEMRRQLKLLNNRRVLLNKSPINIGIGLHKGSVLVGNIGSTRQMEYTVIGDAVNVCSRIEGLTRIFNTDLLISDEFYQEVKELVEVTTCEAIEVKGKKDKIIVHKVIRLIGEDIDI